MENQTQSIDSFDNIVFDNFMNQFFLPELHKRMELGLIPKDFILSAAQVIMFPDGQPNIIRINEEVKAEVIIKSHVNMNITDYLPSLGDVEYIKLAETEFANCDHVTTVLTLTGYCLSFDFQYNKEACKTHLDAAEEFLLTSKYALDNSLIIAFVDNSFSAIELIAKANLLLGLSLDAESKTNHKAINTFFNMRLKDSQVDFDINKRKVFNRLSNLRSKARYVEGDLFITTNEAAEIFGIIEKMHRDLLEYIRLDRMPVKS